MASSKLHKRASRHIASIRPRQDRRSRRARIHCAASGPVFPPSMTVERRESYSLRMYEPFVAVEVSYQGREEGFDALASYFGGLNAEQITFRESQPTILNYDPDGSKRMQMYVGPTRDGETLAELPQPMMEGCRLVAAGGELCAVYRFEGYITPETAPKAVAALKAALERDGVALADDEGAGFFRMCQYGPVYSFSNRENELLLRVKL